MEKMSLWRVLVDFEFQNNKNAALCRHKWQSSRARKIVRGRQHHIFLDLRMNKPFEFILMAFISENLLSLIYIFPLLRLFLWYSSLRHSLFFSERDDIRRHLCALFAALSRSSNKWSPPRSSSVAFRAIHWEVMAENREQSRRWNPKAALIEWSNLPKTRDSKRDIVPLWPSYAERSSRIIEAIRRARSSMNKKLISWKREAKATAVESRNYWCLDIYDIKLNENGDGEAQQSEVEREEGTAQIGLSQQSDGTAIDADTLLLRLFVFDCISVYLHFWNNNMIIFQVRAAAEIRDLADSEWVS